MTDTICDECGDESNSEPGLRCARDLRPESYPRAVLCQGTYRTPTTLSVSRAVARAGEVWLLIELLANCRHADDEGPEGAAHGPQSMDELEWVNAVNRARSLVQDDEPELWELA